VSDLLDIKKERRGEMIKVSLIGDFSWRAWGLGILLDLGNSTAGEFCVGVIIGPVQAGILITKEG
jgi:hypothetical protein